MAFVVIVVNGSLWGVITKQVYMGAASRAIIGFAERVGARNDVQAKGRCITMAA